MSHVQHRSSSYLKHQPKLALQGRLMNRDQNIGVEKYVSEQHPLGRAKYVLEDSDSQGCE
jgi:hypothetical protein